MKKYFLLLLSLIFIACNKNLIVEKGDALGTSYTIQYFSNQKIPFSFDEINQSVSTYIQDSDISKINKGDTTLIVDKHFKTIFLKSKQIWQITNGAFDPTIKTLFDAWGFGKTPHNSALTKTQIDSLLRLTGFEKVKLSKKGTIQKENSNIKLNFNAIAKGYCVDYLGKQLEQGGVDNYLIELGGEILAKGKNLKTKKDWVIGIDNPSKNQKRQIISTLKLRNNALATSGSYRKFKIDPVTGKKYNHIINPKTGYSERTSTISVSVLAKTCMEADAYATAFMVLPLENVKRITEKQPIEVLLISVNKNNNFVLFPSDGFKKLFTN